MSAIHLLKKSDLPTDPGLHADGGGLYLKVKESGARSWIFRYSHRGVRRAIGLGSLNTQSLDAARAAALQERQRVDAGIDPQVDRDRRDRAEALKESMALTFAECVDQYLATFARRWKSERTAKLFKSQLVKYAFPTIGDLPVAEIEPLHMRRILEPIWYDLHETALLIRANSERVLDWAASQNMRNAANPARWKGCLQFQLPSQARQPKHFTALPYAEMPAFMAQLRVKRVPSSLPLEFCILTATRSIEALNARWTEFDFAAKVWTIPKERMKNAMEHRVPLSAAALDVLERQRLQPHTKAMMCEFVFPSLHAPKPMNRTVMYGLSSRMKAVTTHGFRASFRSWAGQRTSFSRDLCEMALSHQVKNTTERAYDREDYLEQRRPLMEAWGQFCTQPPIANVFPLRSITAA